MEFCLYEYTTWTRVQRARQVLIVLLDKLKQKLVSKHRVKLSKGILFLQDNVVFHKAAIKYKEIGRFSLLSSKTP
jgi:hypothetical protein